ncbi:UDP-glucose 4-epimerase GalE [Echinimonas agarilytica]|uniref:UDP-glucose 4-epimerase n=1 Tax=Echinimonas agarilytica TaxID=1215918 RepID=A0AA41W6Q0_9GAMM|nr:UDP-glucose 4-epimerase GalE [Echinimonas agarilytica]MCM2679682.1 UDP-glucose 4-epimerase GalE [Echinimonas agarilytica]
MEVLVTGGAGYIGSHTLIAMIAEGYKPVVVDNLCNSSSISLTRVKEITGLDEIPFYQADIRDEEALDAIFNAHNIDAVIHFAGLKAVGESTQIPLSYYQTNVAGTLVLCEAMKKAGVKRLVFSSSATVYGDPASVPIVESFPTSATNPYGRSKLIVEEILTDLAQSDDEWDIVLLRYFNPVGAHQSGLIGEDPNGIPNNLTPYITQVAVGKLPQLGVFGGDYDTKDGTGVRDYIHVLDLADGHVKSLQHLKQKPGLVTYNLGTGIGYSVLEVVTAFSKACAREIPYQIMERRPGDIAECYADPELAFTKLGWKAERGLSEMAIDAWRWQSMNPDGYPS